MSSRTITVLALATSLLAVVPDRVVAQCDPPPPPPPNILLILSDDYGFPYYGAMIEALKQQLDGTAHSFSGTATQTCAEPPCVDLDIQTPNLDRLAREGIAFQHGYSGYHSCTRAHETLFTGLNQRDLAANLYEHKVGCPKSSFQTFPEALNAGHEGEWPVVRYNSFLAGKHYFSDLGLYFNDLTYNGATLEESDGEPKQPPVPIQSLTSEGIGESMSLAPVKQFIKAQHSNTPWLVVLSPEAPHSGDRGLPPHIAAHYDNMEVKNPPHITTTNYSSLGGTSMYFASMSYFDERVGELVEFLEMLEARSCKNFDDTKLPGPATIFQPRSGMPESPLADPTRPPREWWNAGELYKQWECTDHSADDPFCDPNANYDPYCTPGGTCAYALPDGYPSTSADKCTPRTLASLAAVPGEARRYKGFRTNTLIIYLTDNPAGLQFSKGKFTENGLRTPIVVNLPGRIPAKGLSTALVGAIDVFPTILDYTGRSKRPFPDAMSFRALAESPEDQQGIAEASWRRYFVSSMAEGTNVPISIIDRDGAGDGVRYKLYTGTTAQTTEKVTNLAVDPFESSEVLGNLFANGKITTEPTPGPTPITAHVQALRGALCSWRTCLSGSEQAQILRDLSTGACTAPTNCGNGVVDAGEECDDANSDINDLCSPRCRNLPSRISCAPDPAATPMGLTSPPCPTPAP